MSDIVLPVAVHVVLFKNGKTLLMRRKNTGFKDGLWSVPAGRLKEGEGMKEGASREAKEEIGVYIDPGSFTSAHVMHHRDERGQRVYAFFLADQWGGDPRNCEPDKCSEIFWFDINDLPEDSVAHVREAIKMLFNGKFFSEHGF